MKKIIYLVIIMCLICLSGCGLINNNNNEKEFDSKNEIKSITLTVDKNKWEVSEKGTFSVIIGEGIWLNTGSQTEKNDLRIFYYVNDSEGDYRLLGNIKIGETFQIYSDKMETFEVYCILAHKNYQSSNNQAIYLRSNTITIKVTGKEIYTAQDLQNIQKTGNYILMNDINLNGFDYKVIEEFNGSLDGQGHSIKNLTIELKQDYVGLFGKCGGTVKNLKLENVKITLPEGAKEYEYVGGVTGYSNNGYFENITVSGNIETNKTSYVGGIAGYVCNTQDIKWTGLKNEANILGANYVGGIFGCLNGYDKNNKYSSATYEITDLENSGTITATGNYVGGISGSLSCEILVIKDTYNVTTITGSEWVGGIAGYLSCGSSSEAFNLLSNGSVIGTEKYGGYFGEGSLTFRD